MTGFKSSETGSLGGAPGPDTGAVESRSGSRGRSAAPTTAPHSGAEADRSESLVPLADPVPPEEIARELSAADKLADVGKLSVFEVDGNLSPATLREIGRIREREYRAVGAGRNLEVDIDRFDTAPYLYRQIVVWDPGARQLVAMYRYVETGRALRELGEVGLRTSTLFSFSDRFREVVLTCAVELGRSVVNSESASAIRGLHAVWFGLGALTGRVPGLKYYFGNVTLSRSLGREPVGEILGMLRRSCPPGEGLVVEDVAAREPSPEVAASGDEEGYPVGEHKAALARARERLAPEGLGVPPILISYLKATRRLWAFDTAYDSDFGDAWETAIVVPISQLTEQSLRTFFAAHKGGAA